MSKPVEYTISPQGKNNVHIIVTTNGYIHVVQQGCHWVYLE